MNPERPREITTKASAAEHSGDNRAEVAGSPRSFDIHQDQPIRILYERIFEKAESSTEKGEWFEHLFMAVAREIPDFAVAEIWTWQEWPDRNRLTGKDGRDKGIDLVAELISGDLVAIQCKCYDREHRVSKPAVDSFVSESNIMSLQSNTNVFNLRWVVSTCSWNANAEEAIQNKNPAVRRIDFLNFLDHTILELRKPDAWRDPKPLQHKAIEAVVDGLVKQGNDRGKLIMACGTGKTFTALRVAEQIVSSDGRILFAAPTISLVSQARREWLTHTVRPISALVVCSDRTAGGKGERHEAGPDDLVCPVVTDPREVSARLKKAESLKVIFCTYQSLNVVVDAQKEHSAPRFDLAIADEAHRTTGVDKADRKVNFQHIHYRLDAVKRIYMTATERIYKESSKKSASRKGIDVIDMSDIDTYGPLLHRLKFKDAVAAEELSDYRVIVLGVHENHLTPGIKASLANADRSAKINEADLTRLYGTALAINGYVRGGLTEVPPRLARTLAFASRIDRSKWYAHTLSSNEPLRAQITRKLSGDDRAMDIKAEHLDADSSAIQRGEKLRWLNNARLSNESRMISNVRLFAEGVDVPALDAVAFLDPRESQVDIVQSVGRVMRKAKGKKFGYVVVPVPLDEGEDVAVRLEERGDDYRAVGRVLRALQSHDERLAETFANFVTVYQTKPRRQLEEKRGQGGEQLELDIELKPVTAASIYTHIATESGLGKPGQMTAITIADAVKKAASIFAGDNSILVSSRETLELPAAPDREIATVIALLLCNACLLHKRLKSDASDMQMLAGLDGVARAENPVERLSTAWKEILNRDYEPVFRPALALLERLPREKNVMRATRILAEHAESLADSLNELGYDHAGPLYHSILGSAESDGAFYTNNISALMLAGLVLSPNFVDWSDYKTATGLRILDPACGTGTLLMAALKVIKDRGVEHGTFTSDTLARAHERLVEHSIRGLDINYHATQLAASNLTLGAPNVNYKAMSLHTLQHGPQPNAKGARVLLGSLELLPDAVAGRKPNLLAAAKNAQISNQNEPKKHGRAPDIRELDVVLMNPPYTANDKRGRKYAAADIRRMQQRELTIRDMIAKVDPEAAKVIDANSIRTYFTPLADALLKEEGGVLGKILPTTACTSTSGLAERKFLASRFHIDMIVTSHDPKRPNFSENTDIHESLLICRRKTPRNISAPTLFVSLTRKPEHPSEIDAVTTWLAAIHERRSHRWHALFHWPEDRMAAGDWTPAQWFNGKLASAANKIELLRALTPLGQMASVEPEGRRVRDAFINPVRNDAQCLYSVMWRHQTDECRSMKMAADFHTEPKAGRMDYAETLLPKASRMLIASKINPQAIRTASIFLAAPALGNTWTPVNPRFGTVAPLRVQKAWCAFINSTLGILLLLNRRQKKLTYSNYSLDQLRALPCPDPSKVDIRALAKVFDTLGKRELLAWPQMNQCTVRERLDTVVAETVGVPSAEVSEWRGRLVEEPTISNARVELRE